MHGEIDYVIATIVSWIVISVFIAGCYTLESEEIENKKRNERKLIEANKNNGNQRK